MKQFSMKKGTREVIISSNGLPTSLWHARLYVNNGETVTTVCWKGKTEAGARKWAAKVLVTCGQV